MSRPGFILPLCVLAAACGEPRHGPPEPLSLEPFSVEVGNPVDVVIHGRGFLPRVEADYSGREHSQVDGTFGAWLGGLALEGVTFVSTTRLSGRVPKGLAPGWYELMVVAPDGAEGHLDGAFQVLTPAAVQLALVTPPRKVKAGACSDAVELEAQDAEGHPGRLDVPLDVALSASPHGDISFFADPDCRERIDGVRLGVPGSRQAVYFSGTTAREVRLTGTSSLGMVEQQAWVAPGKRVRFAWTGPLPDQRAGTPFEVSAEIVDAFGNRTDDDLHPELGASHAVPLDCISGCDFHGRAEFREGYFKGLVVVHTPVQGLRLLLSMGSDFATSDDFDVQYQQAADSQRSETW